MAGRGSGKSSKPSNRSAYNVHLHSGPSQSVILSHGSGLPIGQPASRHGSLAGLVVATPLPTPPQQTPTINKILVKVCPRGNKKDSKTFSLRNINPSKIMSVEQLRSAITK